MYWLKKIFKWFSFLSKDVVSIEVPSSASSNVESIEEKGASPIPTDDKTIETITKLKIDVEKVRNEAKNSLKIAQDIRTWVSVGFIILLTMVGGLVFAYWQFTYSANREIRDQLIENKFKMSGIEKDLQVFKKCLEIGGWKTCF